MCYAAKFESAESSKIISEARVAKLENASDLGFPNRRFQDITFRFKKQPFYERKTAVFGEITLFAIGE